MLTRIVKMTFRADKVDDFLTEFNKRKDRIASFPGCTGVDLLRDIDKPGIFFTYSKWDGPESLDKYRNSPLFNETWDIVKKWFDDRPQAWSVKDVK